MMTIGDTGIHVRRLGATRLINIAIVIPIISSIGGGMLMYQLMMVAIGRIAGVGGLRLQLRLCLHAAVRVAVAARAAAVRSCRVTASSIMMRLGRGPEAWCHGAAAVAVACAASARF